MEINKIYQGDSLEVLKTFPDESINMCMTSPPYWGLRDYGVEGQLGLESTFNEYIDKLCNIFDEVKRVLRDDGTCFVNLGDTYSNNTQAGTMKMGNPEFNKNRPCRELTKIPAKKTDLQDKCLCMIPFRFALEMVNRGWILRNTIIWHKPNCMPASVEDRFTVDFEYLFFFAKNKKYYFEQQFQPYARLWNENNGGSITTGRMEKCGGAMGKRDKKDYPLPNENGANKRCVWEITTQPYSEAHFATYPEELCITPIKAGCPENGIVLDPFAGAGTTLMTAKKLNRQYVGIELNPEYIKLAEKRIEVEVGLLF